MVFALALVFWALAVRAQEIEGTLWTPQVLLGGGWRAVLTLSNTTDQTRKVYVLIPTAGIGQRLEFNLDGGRPVLATVQRIGPYTSRSFVLTSASSAMVEGWLEIKTVDGSSIDGLAGYVSRQRMEKGKAVEVLPSLLRRASKKMFFEDAVSSAGAETALAIVNQNQWPTFWLNVEVSALDQGGRLVARTFVNLPPASQKAGFIGQFFANDVGWQGHLASHGGEFRGTVRVFCEGAEVSALAVNYEF